MTHGQTDTNTPPHEYSLCRYCSKFFYEDENSGTSCSYHLKLPVDIGTTGPRGDYAELWKFPCCGQMVKAGIFQGSDRKVDQSPGCVQAAHVVESGWNVFISYSRSDEDPAMIIENELARRGHRVWRDRTNIVVGIEWQTAIDTAIRQADHMIVLLSPDSVASNEVQREIELAQAIERLLASGGVAAVTVS